MVTRASPAAGWPLAERRYVAILLAVKALREDVACPVKGCRVERVVEDQPLLQNLVCFLCVCEGQH
jgi:hypothetical protein